MTMGVLIAVAEFQRDLLIERIHKVALGRNASLPETKLPVFLTVEYNDRRTERFNARAFYNAFPAVF
jgi:hypothetical protein